MNKRIYNLITKICIAYTISNICTTIIVVALLGYNIYFKNNSTEFSIQSSEIAVEIIKKGMNNKPLS